ncbi:hypothetical protein HPB49_018841 [Dermacentor silvarum]|uniref:Uncharacterized protein n=1 Tax=Dermacentor silvarum TaxID=543639 RepID=A0ACB8CZN4_DERSI|nr:hypothetical protein HPB49_018841 [Dermacentor silvarum]
MMDIPMNHPERAEIAGCGAKNRYRSILPNEHSRVRLRRGVEEEEEYINANYLSGYGGKPRAYIATQGPLAHTVADFWAMVWQERAPAIVMITNLVEDAKVKCERYLPEVRGTYGLFTVEVVRTLARDGYTLRELTLQKSGEDRVRRVQHLWYTAWPDHRAPASPNQLLSLALEVEQLQARCPGPIVVHCSAGIGRTGCFVASSIGIRQLREENSVDVLATVCALRRDSLDRKRIREWDKYETLLQQNFGKAKLRRKLSNGGPVFSEEKTPEDFTEAAKAFRSAVNALRICHEYTFFNMSNMDQTMVRMDSPANRTNNVVGESTVQIANTGCPRRGFTVALAACASGHKLPAFVILKEPSGRIPPKAFMSLRIPANVHVTASKNQWMTSDKLQEWLTMVWGPNRDDVRRLLVLDQAPIHKTQATKDALEQRDTDVVYVPAECTSLLQPADVFWNRPFKANLRRTWERFIRKEERTPKGNLRKTSRQDALDFVSEAWAAVTEETVARSFKGCGIANALDGAEHDQLCDIGAVAPELRKGLQTKCLGLVFRSDPEDSFDGFESD